MKRITLAVFCGIVAAPLAFVAFSRDKEPVKPVAEPKDTQSDSAGVDRSDPLEVITLGAGCFWCIEAVLERIKGIEEVTSGYMGGHVKNPTYEEVCSKTTGHAEVVEVKFDPKIMPLEKLLKVFWKLHDPTTLNRQGNDAGPQYRSAIFYYNDAQKATAEQSKKEADASGEFDNPIVTEITKAEEFYKAEGYHQDYFSNNQNQPYCRAVIWPKLKKLGLETK